MVVLSMTSPFPGGRSTPGDRGGLCVYVALIGVLVPAMGSVTATPGGTAAGAPAEGPATAARAWTATWRLPPSPKGVVRMTARKTVARAKRLRDIGFPPIAAGSRFDAPRAGAHLYLELRRTKFKSPLFDLRCCRFDSHLPQLS